MDGSREYNAKQNKSIRDRQRPYDFTHMWNLRDKTNEQTKKKHTLKYRERTGGCQRGGGEDEQNR